MINKWLTHKVSWVQLIAIDVHYDSHQIFWHEENQVRILRKCQFLNFSYINEWYPNSDQIHSFYAHCQSWNIISSEHSYTTENMEERVSCFIFFLFLSSLLFKLINDIQKYTNGDDVTTVVVVFVDSLTWGVLTWVCSKIGTKMPKFASLSNYTYQINNTLNACVKYMFCILCIVVTMSL